MYSNIVKCDMITHVRLYTSMIIDVRKRCEDRDFLMCLNASCEALQMTLADLSGTASTTSTWRGRPGGCPNVGARLAKPVNICL